MTDSSRYRAEGTGHFVQFFARNSKTKTARWHSKFKAEYRALKDARAAKETYEASGKTLWPEDLRTRERDATTAMRRQLNHQEELRI